MSSKHIIELAKIFVYFCGICVHLKVLKAKAGRTKRRAHHVPSYLPSYLPWQIIFRLARNSCRNDNNFFYFEGTRKFSCLLTTFMPDFEPLHAVLTLTGDSEQILSTCSDIAGQILADKYPAERSVNRLPHFAMIPACLLQHGLPYLAGAQFTLFIGTAIES